MLLEAIANFSGTVIFVSHDRYFIDRLATRVLEVENGTVTTYESNYEDYLRKKEELAAGVVSAVGPARSVVSPVSESRPGAAAVLADTNGKPDADGGKERPRRLNPIKQKQMEDRCASLEEEVPRVEAALATTEQQLGVYVSAAETERLTTLANELRVQLAALTAEWEGLMMQLEG